MQPLVSREPKRRRGLGWLVLGMLGMVAITRRRPAPPVALPVRRVGLSRSLEDVVAQMREGVRPHTLVQEADAMVARFAGRAGIFRYETVELIRFSDRSVTFEHLHGPFRRCHEQFDFVPVAGGGHACEHRGTIVMRGGLLGWLLGILVVRGIFDRHVAEHMQASFAAQLDARQRPRGSADPTAGP